MKTRALVEFQTAVDSAPRALRRDECGDWRVFGSRGHVYATPEGYQIFVTGWTAKGWNRAKVELGFARVCNDGESEGALVLDRVPTAAEGISIRKWCGLPKRRDVGEPSEAQLAARQAFANWAST